MGGQRAAVGAALPGSRLALGRLGCVFGGGAFGLDLLWMALMGWVFMAQLRAARVKGALLNIGE